MKKCVNCENLCSDDQALFCPFCGAAYPESATAEEAYDPSQVGPVQQNASFEQGQTPVPNSSETAKIIKGAASNVAQKVNNNAFVQAVRTDLHNSTTLQTVKNTVSQTANKAINSVSSAANNPSGMDKKRIAAIVAAVVIVLGLTVGLNLHRCEKCDEIYFGKQYKISFLGVSEKVCKDCYNEFHSFLW